MTYKGYANPDVLVSTEWVAAHLNDGSIRLLESNEDVLLYDTGHISGAQKIDWQEDLNDAIVRDYVGQAQFQDLMERLGISNDTTIVFYGDKSNWWATYAFWVFQLFGHTNAKVMDGGRQKWTDEGRDLNYRHAFLRRLLLQRPGAQRWRNPRHARAGVGASMREWAAG